LYQTAREQDTELHGRNPWITGSFYLAGMVIVGALFLVMAHVVNILVLPLIIIASILAVSTLGALQLRHDAKLGEKSFLQLMSLTFRFLPLLGKRANNKTDRVKNSRAKSKT
jgi:hypothetical protein